MTREVRTTDDGADNTAPSTLKHPLIRVEDLSRLIREKRKQLGLTLEQAARASGVPLATLGRWERYCSTTSNGDGVRIFRSPDTRTLALLARWLNVSVTRVLDVQAPPEAHGVSHHETDTIPDIVEAHLRADRHLDEKTAGSLGKLFRLAYEQYAELSDPPPADAGAKQTTISDKEKSDEPKAPGTSPAP